MQGTKLSVLSRLFYLILTTTLWDRLLLNYPHFTEEGNWGTERLSNVPRATQSGVLAGWCQSTPLVSVTLVHCLPCEVLTGRVPLNLMSPHLGMYLAGWQGLCSLYSSKATLPVLKVDSWMNPHFHFPLPFHGGMTYSERGRRKPAIAFPGLSLHCWFWK